MTMINLEPFTLNNSDSQTVLSFYVYPLVRLFNLEVPANMEQISSHIVETSSEIPGNYHRC